MKNFTNSVISGVSSTLQGDSIWDILKNAGLSGFEAFVGGKGIGGHGGLYFSQNLKNNSILKDIFTGAVKSVWNSDGVNIVMGLYNYFMNMKESEACE